MVKNPWFPVDFPLIQSSDYSPAPKLAELHSVDLPVSVNALYPPVMADSLLLKMAIEIVDFPMEHGGSFHSYVKLPEGRSNRRIPGTSSR